MVKRPVPFSIMSASVGLPVGGDSRSTAKESGDGELAGHSGRGGPGCLPAGGRRYDRRRPALPPGRGGAVPSPRTPSSSRTRIPGWVHETLAAAECDALAASDEPTVPGGLHGTDGPYVRDHRRDAGRLAPAGRTAAAADRRSRTPAIPASRTRRRRRDDVRVWAADGGVLTTGRGSRRTAGGLGRGVRALRAGSCRTAPGAGPVTGGRRPASRRRAAVGADRAGERPQRAGVPVGRLSAGGRGDTAERPPGTTGPMSATGVSARARSAGCSRSSLMISVLVFLLTGQTPMMYCRLDTAGEGDLDLVGPLVRCRRWSC